MLENSSTKLTYWLILSSPSHVIEFEEGLFNFDYEAQDDPIEDPTLKHKAEFYFSTLDKAINALKSRGREKIVIEKGGASIESLRSTGLKDTSQNDKLKYCKDLETVLTDGNSSDINALDLADEIVAVLVFLNKKESPIEILKFISNLDFTPTLGLVLRILFTLPTSVESGERNFSKLKVIKKFFRSTTTEDRLNGLTTIAIEHELAEEINVKEIILRIKSEKEKHF
ncbi:dimer_Tnp_hAT domain-containing protein [Trichonephila clavipes]|nr:dimer_Tnp_hAT domain-containing protein [Trichonephila clavipes]